MEAGEEDENEDDNEEFAPKRPAQGLDITRMSIGTESKASSGKNEPLPKKRPSRHSISVKDEEEEQEEAPKAVKKKTTKKQIESDDEEEEEPPKSEDDDEDAESNETP